MITVWAPIVLILIAIVGVVIWRGAAITRLAARGVPVTAQVVDKGKGAAGANRMAKPMIKVAYQGPDGKSHHRTVPIGADEWEALETGSKFAMYCLPERPGTSAPASVVLNARQALEARKR